MKILFLTTVCLLSFEFLAAEFHHKVEETDDFSEFSRRFVPQYSYVEDEKTESKIDDEAELNFNQAIKTALNNLKRSNELRPVKAPPEVVLALARQSLREQRKNPVNPNEYVQTDILRSNNYWNDVWTEKVADPEKIGPLRSGDDNTLKTVRVEIVPGSNLYKLVSMTKEVSPRLLYVMNTKDAEIK